jgi:acyl-CoA thioester hydrolase
MSFRYLRRVQFAETDLAGIVHFSVFFRYMEEAEHALWRAAGLTIARAGEESGWLRLAASFEFKAPLHFEEEFEVDVQIANLTRRTLQYGFTIRRGEKNIGTGMMTIAFVSWRAGEPRQALELPMEVVDRLRAAAEGDRPPKGTDPLRGQTP